jgi:hypothetical protein
VLPPRGSVPAPGGSPHRRFSFSFSSRSSSCSSNPSIAASQQLMFHQIQIQSAAGAIILCQDPLRPRSSARRRAVTSRGPSPCDLCPSPVVFFTRISFTRGSTSSCTSPSVSNNFIHETECLTEPESMMVYCITHTKPTNPSTSQLTI